jgi:hypothetical protein
MFISCKAASRLISQSLDKPLSWQDKLALRFHLAICKYCKAFNRQLNKLRLAAKAMVQHAEQDVTIELKPEVKARITIAMKNDL